MLNIHPVGPSVVGYFLKQGPGRWLGGGAGRLGLEGVVAGADLRRVLQGRDPATGRFLPALRSARRRAGWDLVFSAPKSLSLVGGTQEVIAAPIAAAHSAAVHEALALFEGSLLYVRDATSAGGRSPASGAVAVAFDHTLNAGGEPHIHTHLLLANLAERGDGRWQSLGGWWLERRQLDAAYVLGLRRHLVARGLAFDWRLRPDGLVDIAGVPRAAVRMASTRTHESQTGGRYTGRTVLRDRPWRQSAQINGWDHPGGRPSGEAVRVVAGDLPAAVTERLALRGSTFGRREVMLALAGLPGAAFTASEAAEWTEAFVSRCRRVEGAKVPLFTSELALAADRRLETLLEARLQPVATPRAGRGGPEGLLGDDPVVLLTCAPGRSGFLSHAAAVGACAPLWEAEGLRVAVAVRSPGDERRWGALTGVEAFVASRRADVLIVDQADRRTSAELAVLLASAGPAKAVLVEGGTSLKLANPASWALGNAPASVARVDPGPHRRWDVGGATGFDAADRVLDRWSAQLHGVGRGQLILVGLGVAETLELNAAARRHLVSLGAIDGPELRVRGRDFAAGDTVVAVRPVGPRLPAGSVGTVTEVDPERAIAAIRWPTHVATAGRAALERIGHGYAATPRLAARTAADALVLGPTDGIGIERHRIVGSFETTGPAPRARERDVGLGLGLR